jgi:hypothetical protein
MIMTSLATEAKETAQDPTEMKILGLSTAEIRSFHSTKIEFIALIKVAVNHVLPAEIVENIYERFDATNAFLESVEKLLKPEPLVTFEEVEARIRANPQGRGRPLGKRGINQIVEVSNWHKREMNAARAHFRVYHSMKFAGVFEPLELPDGFPSRPEKKAA